MAWGVWAGGQGGSGSDTSHKGFNTSPGLSRFLHVQAVDIVEVDRPNRQLRHREGKSDPTDAVAAARAALSGQARGKPKLRNGPAEQMRILCVARRSAREQRIQTLNQIRQLVFCAPQPIRERFIGRYQATMLKEMAALRPRQGSDPITWASCYGSTGLSIQPWSGA